MARDDRSVLVSRRTLRIIEGRLQTVRARVIEAEVELGELPPGEPSSPAVRRAQESLELADDDLRSVLDLVRETTRPLAGA